MPRRRVLPVRVLGTETVVWCWGVRSLHFVCGGVESTAELPRTLGRIAGPKAAHQSPASDSIAVSLPGDLAQFDDSCMRCTDASPSDRVFPGSPADKNRDRRW